MSDRKIFRESLIGGFNKDDVISFIDVSAKEFEEEIAKLNTELSLSYKKQTELEDISQQYKSTSASYEQKNAELLEKLSELTIKCNEQASQIANLEVEASLASTKAKQYEDSTNQLTAENNSLNNENEKLAKRAKELEDLTSQYTQAKEKISEIELCAYRRAKEIEDVAKMKAENIHRQTASLMEDVRNKMIPIYNDYSNYLKEYNEKLLTFRSDSNWVCENMASMIDVFDKLMAKELTKIATEEKIPVCPSSLNPLRPLNKE